MVLENVCRWFWANFAGFKHTLARHKIAEIIRAPIQAQMDQVYPKNPVHTTQDRPRPIGLGQWGPGQPAGWSWGRLAHLAGRPTYWSADLAHGPHRLNQATCRLPVAPLGRFGESHPVAPCYKYKGGGEIREHTHTHTHLTSLLSCIPCIVFRLSGV